MYILYGVFLILVILGFTFLCAYAIKMSQGKKLDPNVRNLKEAFRTIKNAQQMFYRETGIYTQNFYEILSFYQMNGLIPEKAQKTKNRIMLEKSYGLDVLKNLNYNLGEDDFVEDVFKKQNLPILPYLSSYGEATISHTAKEIYERIEAMQLVVALVFEIKKSNFSKEEAEKCMKIAKSNKFKFTETEKVFLMGDYSKIDELGGLMEYVYILSLIIGKANKVYPANSPADMKLLRLDQNEVDKLEIDTKLAKKF